MTRIDHTAPFNLTTLTDAQLAEFVKVAQGRADSYQRLAAAHQRAADSYRKELRRRKRAAKKEVA